MEQNRLQSGTFWEGRGLYCCQQTEPVSEGSGGLGGVGGSGEGGERTERGTGPLVEETPHAPGSPPSETAGCCSPSSCLLHCGQNQECERPQTSDSTGSTGSTLHQLILLCLLQGSKPPKSIRDCWMLTSSFPSAPLWTKPGL